MTSWCVIVPVKRLDRAKSRLDLDRPGHGLVALPPVTRAELALAFACDAVAAATESSQVAHVVVVTDDPLAALTLDAMGAVIVPDSPDDGINPALTHGYDEVMRRWPGSPVAAMSADLPCARGTDLDAALARASTIDGASFMADVSGIGSTMYLAPSGAGFAPAFGRRSRAEHRAAGAVELVGADLHRLRRDVDTAVDLWDAIRLGVGEHTDAALAPA